MTDRPAADRTGSLLRGSGPAFTLAWFTLLLVVVFTIAFWTGRSLGPEPDDVAPVAPHGSQGH